MPLLTRPRNPRVPVIVPSPPSLPRGCSDPKSAETWDYSFKRLVPLLQSPPVGAGILAMTLFLSISFFSNVLLVQTTMATLGITVTLGTFGILALVLLILFFL
ncbi:hypothetical protein E4K67_00835 [Desulfosporosinus fructosivorans]|uniref:Uncharacterized protein n=1 Tax=Desulfosporosinus fructosivorans TaxID=2018669 RepID=A0A4Z0R9R5_9FIRM|nr:hypothetical protein [Desulfosporosinus fructosivorans]TGE39590.1 hypothetical protein E4K67_00835 [Desulfosporosinus fructosivorans]